MSEEKQEALTPATELTAEEVAAATGGKIVDPEAEWNQGEEIPSAWFKFDTVGAFIKGTLVGKKIQASRDAGFKDQWVYELKTETGITKVGISVDKDFINNKMKYVAVGQVVGFKYLKDMPSAKFKGKSAKSIDVRIFGFDPDYKPQDESVDVAYVSFN